jgi:hypothetical protein
MSKRKSKKSQKPAVGTTGIAEPAQTPAPAISAADLAGSEAEPPQAARETETRLPELLGQETETQLPPVPPPELEPGPPLAAQFAEPESYIAPPVEVRAEASELAHTTAGAATTAGPSPQIDGPRPAITGMDACQALFMEMARDNLDFAASLASMRSPFDIFGAATMLAGKRMDMYGRFSKVVTDIAAGRGTR